MSARDEQTKLTASYLNGLAIALAAVGSFAPVVSVQSSMDASEATGGTNIVLCLIASVALHMLARLVLRRLGR